MDADELIKRLPAWCAAIGTSTYGGTAAGGVSTIRLPDGGEASIQVDGQAARIWSLVPTDTNAFALGDADPEQTLHRELALLSMSRPGAVTIEPGGAAQARVSTAIYLDGASLQVFATTIAELLKSRRAVQVLVGDATERKVVFERAMNSVKSAEQAQKIERAEQTPQPPASFAPGRVPADFGSPRSAPMAPQFGVANREFTRATSPATAPAARMCARCGDALGPGAAFCSSCGANAAPAAAPVPAPTVCPNCRKPVIPGKKFCTGCGTPVR